MDTVKYVSKEFLNYIKTTYGITETDTIPALIVVKPFSTTKAFKTAEGYDINDSIDVPKNIIAFSGKNGYISKKSKTRKYALNMKLHSDFYIDADNYSEGSKSLDKVSEIKFETSEDMKASIAFSKTKIGEKNIIPFSEIDTFFEVDKKAGYKEFKEKIENDKEIDDWKLLYIVPITSLLPNDVFSNDELIVLNKGDSYRWIVEKNENDIINKFHFGCFKRGKRVGSKDFFKNDMIVITDEVYSKLSDIIGKEVEDYLFMYSKGDADCENLANILKKYEYNIEESNVKIEGKNGNIFKGCFRKTYYNKISNSNVGSEVAEVEKMTETEFKKINEKVMNNIINNIGKNENRLRNGRIINEAEASAVEKFELLQIELCTNFLYSEIDRIESEMSEKYRAAGESNYELGKIPNRQYNKVVKYKWFLFYNDKQAKELHSKYKDQISRIINTYFSSSEFFDNFNKWYASIYGESNISNIKSDLYNIIKEESQIDNNSAKQEIFKEIQSELKNAIYFQFIQNYDIGSLTIEEIELPKELGENKSIKSDIYNIIKEAEENENNKIEDDTAVFILDVKLQNKGENNFFAITSNNAFVEKCYLKTGKWGDKAKFILDVWSPLSVKIENIGSWLDKGLVDMGSSWVTMLGKGMKSIGNIAKTGKEIGKGTYNFVKNRHKDYKSFSDYIKS